MYDDYAICMRKEGKCNKNKLNKLKRSREGMREYGRTRAQRILLLQLISLVSFNDSLPAFSSNSTMKHSKARLIRNEKWRSFQNFLRLCTEVVSPWRKKKLLTIDDIHRKQRAKDSSRNEYTYNRGATVQ